MYFANELSLILSTQVQRGFPPFGAVLLVIAATRDNWRRIDSDSSVEMPRVLLREIFGARGNQHLDDVVDHLCRLNDLENSLRIPTKAKQVLTDRVFETIKDRTTPEVASQVMLLLQERFQSELDDPSDVESKISASESLANDIRTLRFQLPKISAEQLRLRQSTGLDQIPEPADIELELPPQEAIRKLLNELQSDPELGALANAARQLMSVLTLPRPLSDRDDLAQGGVSDITNRGPLDRLLLSELAHDDLTLAVRVAVNESLYLRRESPRKQVQRSRIVVLDSGIRMWGTPRVLATSLAMALGANIESNTTLLAYSAEQTALNPIELETRKGLTQHLRTLRHELHPGKCLRELKRETETAANEAEIVLVTNPAAFEDSEFIQNVIESKLESLFIASIGRQGTVELFKFTPTGRKLIKRVDVDLDAMVATKPLIDRNRSSDLPAIMSVEPFPIRMPINGDTECRWGIGEDGAISISNDHRLQWWNQTSSYGQQLSTKIRPSQVRWTSREPIDGQWQAVLGRDGNAPRLIRINVTNLQATEVLLDTKLDSKVEFFGHCGFIFAVTDSKIVQLSCESGQVIDSKQTPTRVRCRSNRFIFSTEDNSWLAVSLSREGITLEPVSFGQQSYAIHHVFEHPEIEGPIGVDFHGNLNFSATGGVRTVGHALGEQVFVESVSPDGRQLKLKANQKADDQQHPRVAIVDVPSGRVTNSRYERFQAHVRRDKLIQSGPIRNKFRSIGISGRHTITLTSRSGALWDVACVNGDIRLRQAKTAPEWHSKITFESASNRSGNRIRLKVAKWDDGSKIWLDSRGLLHLRSSNLDIPEVSLVLTEKPISGWCNDGNVFGLTQYIGVNTKSSQQVFNEVITEFTRHLVRSC